MNMYYISFYSQKILKNKMHNLCCGNENSRGYSSVNNLTPFYIIWYVTISAKITVFSKYMCVSNWKLIFKK